MILYNKRVPPVLLLIAVQLLYVVNAADNQSDVCRFFPNNTKIRDPDSCNRYITCINFISYHTNCTGLTPFYDKSTEKCVKSLSDESSCYMNCTNTVGSFVADPKSCKGYYYCQDTETPLFGECPDGTHFNVNLQKCVYKDDSSCKAKSFEFCAIIKDGINFNDDSSCEKYFQCKKGVKLSKSCSSEYYHVASGKCVRKSLVDCPVHPLPTDVCGTPKKPKANVFVGDGATCRGYYFCAAIPNGVDTNPRWSQCPADQFFNPKTQSCTDPVDVKCPEDRCDGRTATFVNSSTKGCRHYLRCKDGIMQNELTCGNTFFDEKLGICTSDIVSYNACT